MATTTEILCAQCGAVCEEVELGGKHYCPDCADTLTVCSACCDVVNLDDSALCRLRGHFLRIVL